MRDYGRVYCSFWTSPDIQALSDDGRLLALYLLSGPHGTLAGVCRLPDGYVCEDLRWSAERVAKGFAELFANGFANRCETTKWVWIRKFLEWNTPENPNQWKAARKIAEQVPEQCAWRAEFSRAFTLACGERSASAENGSQTVAQPLLERLANQEQDQEQNKKQEKEGAPAARSRSTHGYEHRLETRTVSKATACPDPFLLTAEMAAWAKESTPAVDPKAETAKFVDHWRAHHKTKNDWTAAWRNWMRKAQEIANSKPSARPAAAPAPSKPIDAELLALHEEASRVGFRNEFGHETTEQFRQALQRFKAALEKGAVAKLGAAGALKAVS